MNKKEKQREINNATRIFRETLEKTYRHKNEFYGIGIHRLDSFFYGKVSILRLKNGDVRISGNINKDAINEFCRGIPFDFRDWNIFPLVITLFNKDIGVKQDV